MNPLQPLLNLPSQFRQAAKDNGSNNQAVALRWAATQVEETLSTIKKTTDGRSLGEVLYDELYPRQWNSLGKISQEMWGNMALAVLLAAASRKVPSVEALAKEAWYRKCGAPPSVSIDGMWDACSIRNEFTAEVQFIVDSVLSTSAVFEDSPRAEKASESTGFDEWFKGTDPMMRTWQRDAWQAAQAHMQAKVDELVARVSELETNQGNQMMNPAKTEWVKCPVCGERGMRKESDEEGCSLILCVNHCCGSNGGTNFDALPFKPDPFEAWWNANKSLFAAGQKELVRKAYDAARNGGGE